MSKLYVIELNNKRYVDLDDVIRMLMEEEIAAVRREQANTGNVLAALRRGFVSLLSVELNDEVTF